MVTLTITFSGITSVGCSLLFFGSLSCLPRYFRNNLCIATSVVCSGSNFSGVTFSPLIAHLVKHFSLRTCLQVFSITALIPILGGAFIHRHSTKTQDKEREDTMNNKNDDEVLYQQSLMKNRNFILIAITMSLIELCYYIPHIHLVHFLLILVIPYNAINGTLIYHIGQNMLPKFITNSITLINFCFLFSFAKWQKFHINWQILILT